MIPPTCTRSRPSHSPAWRASAKGMANLLAGIAAAQARPLARLIVGLGIRFVGEVAAQALAAAFGSLDALMQASAEQSTMSRASARWWPPASRSSSAFEANRALVHKLKQVGVHAATCAVERQGDELAGQSFVITGTLPTLAREQAAADQGPRRQSRR